MGKRLLLALCAMVMACSDDGGNPVGDVTVTIDDGPPALTNQTAITFMFHSTPVENGGFLCQVDDQSPGQCSSPFMSTVTAEGDHTFNVAALDTKMHPGMSAQRTWRTDTTPPDTTITRMPAAIDQSANPEFEFTGSDSGGGTITFECNIDGVGFVGCASPQILDVGEGSHTFEIRAVDGAGNVDASPASFTWIVDTSSPDTMITGGPDDASTSGPSPTFTFTSTDVNATFECKVDAAAFAPCVTPLLIAPALVDGMHTFEVRAKDTNGVVDPTPATRAWTVDAIPPDVQITMSPPNPSNDNTPTFDYISSDSTATFECKFNGGTFSACAPPYTSPSALPEGSNTFSVRAIDPAGNRTVTPATYTWVVDTIGPTVTITGAPAANSNDTTPSVTFSTTGGPTSVTCQVDAMAPVACGSPFTSAALPEGNHTITVTVADAANNTDSDTATFAIDLTPPTVSITPPVTPTNDTTPTFMFTTNGATSTTCRVVGVQTQMSCTSPFTPAALSDGAYTFDVTVVDAVGNSASASVMFVIDTAPPSLSITSGPPNPTNNPTPQIGFSAEAGSTTTCSTDGSAFMPCTSPYTTPSLGNGNHTVQIRAVDAAGNTAMVMRTFTVDLIPPVVTVTPIAPDPTTDNTPTLTFSVTGGAISVTCQVDGGTIAPCTNPFTPTALTDGMHTITIRATDDAGNVGIGTDDFTVDTGAPVVTITSSPPNPTNDNTPTVVFTVTGTFVSLQCQVDTGAFVNCTSPFTSAALADGTHTITVRATDAASNSGTAFKTFVVDTTPPVVTITTPPANPGNDNTPSTSFQVTGGAIMVQCQVDGGALANCTSPFTTTTLGEGSHTVNIVATDDVGNVGNKSTTFVVDTIAPPLTLSNPGSLTNDNTPSFTFSSDGTQSNFTCKVDGGSFGVCTSVFTTATLADGSHTVFVRANDLAGNFTEVSRTFDVDATPPTVTITLAPPAFTNDNTPTINFTTGGSPVSTDCQVASGPFMPCSMTFTAPMLGEGASSITVRVIDAATNMATATANFTVDTIAPVVNITTTFANPVSNKRPPISFTATGAPAAGVQCQIDSGAFAVCTSAFTPGFDLTEGSHTITVRATDQATNSAQDSITFTVDTIAPTVSFTSTPSNPSNTNAPTFGFTTAGSPTATDCKLDGGAFAACNTPNYVPGTLSEGSHTVTIRVTDAAGNTSQVSYTWTVDTIAPTAMFTTQPPANTSDNTPTVIFTSAGSPTLTQCKVDSGSFVACTAGGAGFTSGVLADGAHSITVRVTDAAGNFSEIVANFTVDTMAPTVTITTPPPANTNNNTPSIDFTTGGMPTAIDCRISPPGGFNPCSSPFAPGTLADGTYTVTVRVTDAAGNTATAATTFTVDTVAPTAAFTSQPPANTNDNTATVVFTTAGSPTLTQCKVDGGSFSACSASPANFTTSALADGAHSITVRVTDAAGNFSEIVASFTVDTTPPAVAITSAPPNPTNDNTPSVSFTNEVGATTACSVDGGAFNACSSPFTATTLADGTHSIVVRATDAAGNQATASTGNFVVDTAAPAVSITAGPANPGNDNTPSVTFTNEVGATTTCSVDGGAFASCTSPFTTTTLADGTHSITVRATDAAGNSATASTGNFVIDTVPPAITITTPPPNPTNDSTPSLAYTITGGPASATCKVDAGSFAACGNPFVPTTLSDGSHTITIRATDTAGNIDTDSATFTVDTQVPTVTLTSVPPNPTNDNTPSVSFTALADATALDCKVDGGAFATCTSPFTATTLADGSHTISVRATDAATNTDTKSTTFTVDTAPPTVTITVQPPDPTNDNTPSITFTNVGGASATCKVDALAAVACNSGSFTSGALADGAHTIVVTGFDAAGNSATDSATFTIDTVPPTITVTGGPRFGWPTGDNPQTFTFTHSDPTQCSVNGGASYVACNSPFVHTPTGPGIQTILIKSGDAAGNSTTVTITNDYNPTVKCQTTAAAAGSVGTMDAVMPLDKATVEFWYRRTGTKDQNLVDFRAQNGALLRIDINGQGDLRVTEVTSTGVVTSRTYANTLDYNDWHHYAVTWTGVQQRFFVDGVELLTGTGPSVGFDDIFASAPAGIIMNVGISGPGLNHADGAFLDLRISSANIYTANFTPTYPQTTQANTLFLYGIDELAGNQSFETLVPTDHTITWTDSLWSQCFP